MKMFSTVCLALLCAAALRARESTTPEERLRALGLQLPEVPAAIANYVPAVRAGSLVFLSGQIPRGAEGKFLVGTVGLDVSPAEGAAAARLCALQLLAVLKGEIGELSRVKRIVRVGGFVHSTPDFTAQPQVLNGASDLLVAVFGERGRHARAAVGVSALPAGAPVEVELVAEIAE